MLMARIDHISLSCAPHMSGKGNVLVNRSGARPLSRALGRTESQGAGPPSLWLLLGLGLRWGTLSPD